MSDVETLNVGLEDLAHELEPVFVRLTAEHKANTKPWYPFELVPWSEGKNFEPGYVWNPDEYNIPDGARIPS